MVHPSPERISLRPLSSCPRPNWASLRSDFQAGLTVAIFAVPQALAYAKLAGVPPINGLYCAVVMSFVASLFGSSPFLNTGPTNTASLLLASVIAPLAAKVPPNLILPMIWQFTLLVGLFRLILGLVKAGPLVRLVPEHAILGFVTAANLLIALGQFNELLGVKAPKGGTFNKLVTLAGELPQTQWPALVVGFGHAGADDGFRPFFAPLSRHVVRGHRGDSGGVGFVAVGAVGAAYLARARHRADSIGVSPPARLRARL